MSKGLLGNISSCIVLNDASYYLPCFLRMENIMPGLKEPIKITTWKLNDTVIEAIKSDLNDHNWSELRELETNEAFNQLHNTLLSSIGNRAPIKTKTNEPWLNASILKCIKNKRNFTKQPSKKDCIECDREKYKNYRSCLTKLKRYC